MSSSSKSEAAAAQALEPFVAFAHRLADASGDVIRPWFRKQNIDVTDKGTGRAGFDPVTEADKQAETMIRRMINETYPTHSILGEEQGHQRGAEPAEASSSSGTASYTWVIDPIDGTRAFICGQAQWGTLIALNDGQRPILGVLDQPITRERWVGRGGRGGNGHAELVSPSGTQTIHTRPCADLASAVLMSTHPTSYFDAIEQPAFAHVSKRVKMTRFGGDCYMYGLLAMGFVDVIVEAQLHPWDVQALIPIIESAGGLMTSWDGGDAQNGGRIIAAGDARVHAEAIQELTRALAAAGK